MNQHTSLAALDLSDEAATPSDYDSDLVLWFEQQAALLRTKKFEQLDLGNLIEELEAMAGRDRRELASRLEVLLMHLLKCQMQPEKKSSSWIGTIHEQRSEIGKLLEQSPSLRRCLVPFAERVYPAAVERTAIQTGMNASNYPSINPYTHTELLDPTFVP